MLPALALGALGLLALDALLEDPEVEAIRDSAERHVKRGAAVFADLPGWPRPPTINGHIPDVYAIYKRKGVFREVVEEFENEKSAFRTHARRQHVTFLAWAREGHNRKYTQILVRGGRGGHS